MLKEYQKSFSSIHQLVDAIAVSLCWFISYLIRFNYIPDAEVGLGLTFFKLTPVLIILTLYSFYKNNLYKSQRFTHRYKEILSVLKGNVVALISFVLLVYFFGAERLSRLTLGIYFLTSTTVLICLRIIARNILRSIRVKGKNLRYILLIGSGRPIIDYIKAVRKFKDSGIRFTGWLDSDGLAKDYSIPNITGPYLKVRETERFDSIIISYQGSQSEKLNRFMVENYNDLIPIQVLPDLSYSLVGSNIEEFAGIPILSVNQPSLNIIELFLKRLIDFFGSLLGLIVLIPFLFLISLLVKLSSKGPIFYGQERLGLDGSLFKMWKFRTMKIANEKEDENEWSNKDNPRKTRIGHFLRRTSLDELPQLFNVLVGDMSLVGPRPERPFFVEKFKEEIHGYMLRHKMKAGITGWAQVNGWRGDTSIEKRIECDIYYIKNWGLLFDLKILFLTFFKGLINKNAY